MSLAESVKAAGESKSKQYSLEESVKGSGKSKSKQYSKWALQSQWKQQVSQRVSSTAKEPYSVSESIRWIKE
jgi:hypothetical protein